MSSFNAYICRMKHHESLIIFLITFMLLSALVFKPTRQVRAQINFTDTLTCYQMDSIQKTAIKTLPVYSVSTITTNQNIISYLVITLGSILTVIIMSILKFLFPQIFGSYKIP